MNIRTAVTALLGLVLFVPLSGYCEVTPEVLCFSTEGEGALKFELRTYYDDDTGWNGAFVKYTSDENIIPLVLKILTRESMGKGIPDDRIATYLEIEDGSVSGEYRMESQGAQIISMEYKKKGSAAAVNFVYDSSVEPSLERGCK